MLDAEREIGLRLFGGNGASAERESHLFGLSLGEASDLFLLLSISTRGLFKSPPKAITVSLLISEVSVSFPLLAASYV